MLVACLFAADFARAAKPGPGFTVLDALPKGQAARVAIVSGVKGRPVPEQWKVVVHDRKAPEGLREYTVSGGEVIAQRDTSELAEKLTAEDVIGPREIAVFPQQLAELARSYAAANQAALGSVDFLLRKVGAEAAPLWTLTCRRESGARLGVLVITAGKGRVVSHEGFAKAPADVLNPDIVASDADFLENESSASATEKSKKSSSGESKGNIVTRPFRKVGRTLKNIFTR